MLKTCCCNDPGCQVCDSETYKKSQHIVAISSPEVPKERFVDFNKLLVTEDKQELTDILKQDIRDK